MRRPQLPEHRRGGGGVGWRHHRPERDRDRPWHLRHQLPSDQRHDDHRKRDRAEREPGHGAPMGPQIAGGEASNAESSSTGATNSVSASSGSGTTVGTPGTSANPAPANATSAGYGVPRRRDSSVSAAPASSRATTISKKNMGEGEFLHLPSFRRHASPPAPDDFVIDRAASRMPAEEPESCTPKRAAALNRGTLLEREPLAETRRHAATDEC